MGPVGAAEVTKALLKILNMAFRNSDGSLAGIGNSGYVCADWGLGISTAVGTLAGSSAKSDGAIGTMPAEVTSINGEPGAGSSFAGGSWSKTGRGEVGGLDNLLLEERLLDSFIVFSLITSNVPGVHPTLWP
ncbi:hypothetical protein NDU88_006655 [Pleurodeles waltl]|uniref:Uncharacterized protein n=1 Tax=Pleurodeles waltl TaxID=8319 RepID=A0AAV7NTX7_PLEWA|nr:hypothetical protein NDU88_006655 [Pleurodeles waltl]